MSSFKIENKEIKSKVILAPMAGITSFSYRKFMKTFNKEMLTYTEMISDYGLIYQNKKTLDMLKTDGSDRPLAIQIFGGSKKTLIEAIKILEGLNINYDFLDINLACPVPKVVKNIAGSSWLKDPALLYDCMKEVVKVSNKPVTAKLRLGFDKVNIIENAKALEKAGVKFIAIHARTRNQFYTGEPDFDSLKSLKDNISIPFAVSGNIFTVADAIRALSITYADAILVARGGVGNPLLVKNIEKALIGKDFDEKTNIFDQAKYLKKYSSLLIKEYGERKSIGLLRGIAPKFFNNLPNTKKIRTMLSQEISSKNDLNSILNNLDKLTN